MPEVDDVTLTQLKGAYALLDKLLKDPKTRPDAERLVKVHKPDFPTTNEVIEPVNKQIEALTKKFDDYVRKVEDDRQDREADAAFDRLRKSGYTDEGIGKIKNLMKERTIPDVEAAAALFEKQNPPASPAKPSGFESPNWGLGVENADDDTKLLFENEDRWAEKEAAKAWKEAASG